MKIGYNIRCSCTDKCNQFGRMLLVLSGLARNVNLNEADVILPNIDSLIKIFPNFCYKYSISLIVNELALIKI